MKEQDRKQLLGHLQTAAEIELSTIPIYLYTYYSINRLPTIPGSVPAARAEKIKTFANKAGGLIMSVAVEEMLHMSLASNIMRALGGQPQLYGHSPKQYPTNLPHHKAGFSVGLEKLSSGQLDKFLGIENPEKPGAKPQGDNWDTIGQFYDFIRDLILRTTTDADFSHEENQLAPHKAYYPPNNVDTIYPRKATYPADKAAKYAVYPNAKDSGNLVVIKDQASALAAIDIICHQGEGYVYDLDHKYDDKHGHEETHYYKFEQLQKEIGQFTATEQGYFIHEFLDNPTKAKYPANFGPLVDLCNAVYSYLYLMTEACYQLTGDGQSAMFNMGMHKGMIFILDKIIGDMRGNFLSGTSGPVLAPTFDNYTFKNKATAKQEMIDLFNQVPKSLQPGAQILQRIQDLPDINVGPDGVVHFGTPTPTTKTK